MPTTTTYAAIRDNFIALIEALTPATQADKKFRRSLRREALRENALQNGSASFRAFEITLEESEPDREVMDPSALERNETCLLTVAYPVTLGLYGNNDRDDIESVMRADARQLRDLLFSSSSYLAGHSASFPTRLPFDRENENVWFMTLSIQLIYTEAQTLT